VFWCPLSLTERQLAPFANVALLMGWKVMKRSRETSKQVMASKSLTFTGLWIHCNHGRKTPLAKNWSGVTCPRAEGFQTCDSNCVHAAEAFFDTQTSIGDVSVARPFKAWLADSWPALAVVP
jgi:hypothetical protein